MYSCSTSENEVLYCEKFHTFREAVRRNDYNSIPQLLCKDCDIIAKYTPSSAIE